MKLLIFVQHPFPLWNAPQWFSERLQQEFADLRVVHLAGYEQVDNEIRDTDIAIAWSIKPEQVRAAKKLGWVHCPAAAVHTLIIPELVKSDIIITNARDVHAAV